MVESVPRVKANDTNYFIWHNWGSIHVNVYVTPSIGDVEIFMNSYETDIIGEAYSHLPVSEAEATWSSRRERSRNKLEINVSKNDKEKDRCVVCYFLVGIRNMKATSYEVTITTTP